MLGIRGKFYNLADVSWFYHADIRVAVPLFGREADKLRQVKAQHNISDGKTVFTQVLDGKRTSREGWSCGPPPSELATLPDGASIIGLAARPSAEPHAAPGIVLLPDYGAVLLGAQTAEEQISAAFGSQEAHIRPKSCKTQ